jgi:hypothetical protein
MTSSSSPKPEARSVWRRDFFPKLSVFRFARWLFSWRMVRRYLFCLACLATLVAVFFAVENWRGARAWNQFRREWEAKGERLDIASVIPARVPDEQNFAMTPLLAPLLDYDFRRPGRWRDTNAVARVTGPQALTLYPAGTKAGEAKPGNIWVARPTDLNAWQQYFRGLTNFPTTPQAQDAATDVLLALSKYDAELNELRAASRRPYSMFPIHYDEDYSALLPHLAVLKRIALVLQLRATAALAASKSEQALTDVLLSLRLADSIKSEPFIISYLVRLAIIEIALEPVWEGIVQHRWNDAQLQALANECETYDFVPDQVRAIRGERAFANAVLDRMATVSRWERARMLAQLGEPPDEESSGDIGSFRWLALGPAGWLRQNQVAQGVWFQDMIVESLHATNRAAQRNYQDGMTREKWEKQVGWPSPYNLLARILTPAFGNSRHRSLWAQTGVNLARIACSLERYRLARGQYPASLDALVPQFLGSVPPDFYSGGPLKYGKTDNGQFVLYSVGRNQRDDGGTPHLNKAGTNIDREKGDWVWQFPSR